MGKGRAKAVEKRVLDQKLRGSVNVPSGPVYYPTEDEFKNPLDYIHKIKPEAEAYGICKIVPPKSWKPPFGLDMESVRFPTKTQEIHRLQFRPASCNSKTFQLEYGRFVEEQLGKKVKKKKRVVFEGGDLDLCKVFNAVKRFGGYDKVVKGKKWGEVYQFMSSGEKISKCAKHVLCQLYKEHLYEFEKYHGMMSADPSAKGHKRNRRCSELSSSKRRKRNADVKNHKVESEEEEVDQACEQCKSDKHGEVMLLCDSCNKGWHIYCLSPPLKHIPPGNWYCLDCLNTDEDTFGFVPGKCLLLEDFKRIADRAKRKWFGSGPVSRTQIEKKFWEIVEGSGGDVEVMYGNDLDTSVYGSGFPRIGDRRPESVEANVWDEYCHSPWNLNNMPKLKGSMLQAIRHNINGVTVPWLYLGMLFSAFCWHFEDHCFYSVNYHHWGEAKCWYGVPGSAASAFEKVMRKALPDLFDAQPDLLFQLVTMLSPAVLQENKVPVYTVLQEPGNFVITFPKSFHAGFNFGLNCAEAVNFATADWLPYGGYGAELYRLYRKPAVISHEELLCVVAKGNSCDGKGSIYLKKELLRIYSKEKTLREQLWKSGILRSSPMFLPECPDSVGIEEDTTCIICQQFLHLSAIVCSCRPSVFACLEHWKHLCECEPTKLRLVYRYTLAELHGMVQEVEKFGDCKTQETKNSQRPSSGTKRSGASNKKEGMQVCQARPAEDWLRRASKVLQDVFSSDVYATLLKEAEQFLWGGSEMNRVRDVAKSLIKAKIWAEAVGDCLSKVEGKGNNDTEKVHLEFIDELLKVDPVPCFQSGYLKLKDFAEEARKLSEKIDCSLSSSPTIAQMELLHSEVSSSPVSLSKHKILSKKISSAKMLAKRARCYLAASKPPGIELDELFKLKSEILELQVTLTETEGILDLLKKSELARDKCSKVLSGFISLKNVEDLVHEFDGLCSINIRELNILRQYHVDALSWISRFDDTMADVREGKDQRKLISDLSSLLQDGASLGIQVEGLPLVEVELKKASCREKAQTVYAARSSLDFIEQLLSEAVVLQIEEEKLFVEIAGTLSTARFWEERASSILASETQMSDLKELVQMSVNIGAVLPSLKGIENTISLAETWLQNSEPFLSAVSSTASSPCSLLELPVLKDLVAQSKSLGVQLEEPRILETLLLSCERWQCDNHPLLQETEDLLDTAKTDDGKHSTILPKIMDLITRVDCARTSGLSLGLNLEELPKLQTASLKLGWCYKTILLGSSSPSPEIPEDLGKPSLQKIQQHLEAGQTLKILPEEYHLGKRLVELKDTGQEWAKRARKVVTDSGALALEDVFELISEGENLPVIAEEELQALRARSMLHCVCLKPYNSRFMVSCSQCGEWYHTYCVKLHWRPEAYVCFACCPPAESSPKNDPSRSMEPKTPSLDHRRARRVVTGAAVGDLQWKSRKRIKRVAKRCLQVHILPWFFTREPK
ncbi:transcription factor jumonji (jmjC) domain-containing protein [Raphanus sativus]|uniref:Lysine-specific demethylase JMJ17 isoform X2 n=1 Tax=Raphanus sativus TaxID=3726 RepID=A0A6J0LAE3_RAPSA|nr:lysine-specific demethylase JMJ17 isoform X2 [Raphanus sativus]KAJ4877103.1 transcription factor jumonji (jmjC) domain-containing protein [Raphanus sativus]